MIIRVGLKKTRVVEGEEEEGGGKRGEGEGDGGGRCCDQSQQIMTKITHHDNHHDVHQIITKNTLTMISQHH